MIDVSLKEWACVCDLLVGGEFALLLRKGGIQERSGPGVFELDHRRFLLFPSWAHQKPHMMKPAYREAAAPGNEPEQITFGGMGEAGKIWVVPSRQAFDQLDDLHPWSSDYVDMRFNYRPENPLYLVAVRVTVLNEPKTISYRNAFAGCHSWVPLESCEAASGEGTPAMDEQRFSAIIDRVDTAFGSGGQPRN
jgi:hypothetical protein